MHRGIGCRAAVVLAVAGVILLPPFGGSGGHLRIDEAAAAPSALVRVIHTSRFAPPSPDPSGIVYLPDSDTLLVSDAEVDETDLFSGVNLFEISLSGRLVGTASTRNYSEEPTGVALDRASGDLFVSDDNVDGFSRVSPGRDGRLHTDDDIVTPYDTGVFRGTDPEDITFDPESGHLFILDGRGARVYRLTPGLNGAFDAVPPAGDDEVTFFETSSFGVTDPEGMALDPESGHLFVIGQPPALVAEVTRSGSLVGSLDISGADPLKPSGLAIAPGSENPDEPSLYVVDRRVDNAEDPDENDGRIYELSLSLIPGNRAPRVEAGPDRAVVLPDVVELHGTVTDDGRPDPVVWSWKQVSGAGIVTFGNASALQTVASFSLAGEYMLRLSASDGDLTGSDHLTVRVSGTLGERVTETRVADGSDDAEELGGGRVKVRSTNLKIVFDGGSNQTVGLRFRDVDVPPSATVSAAYIQFHADGPSGVPTTLTLRGEDADDAAPFSDVDRDLSSRPTTTAEVPWIPPRWTRDGEAGVDQRTPNIAPLLNEIVSRPGWRARSALAILITGRGQRVAASANRSSDVAPLLHIEYLPPRAFRRGDVNGDGGMDISDSVLTLIFLFLRPGSSPDCLESADVNDDLGVDVSDVIYGLAFLFQNGPPPLSPFGECGHDATPGLPGCESSPCATP